MYYSDNSTNPDNDVINSIVWISGHIFCLLYYAQSKPVPLVSDHTSPILLYRKEMHACDMSILIKTKQKVHVCLTSSYRRYLHVCHKAGWLFKLNG